MASSLPDGTKIAGHVLQGVLGSGGFGITYLAQNTATGELAAIKEYFPRDIAERHPGEMVFPKPDRATFFRRGLEAFLQEANILRDLPEVPSLVQVKSAFEKNGTAYCVMRFIPGDSLDVMAKRFVNNFGHIPEELILDLSDSILRALAEIHSVDLIHRDIKPVNMMIRKDQQPILIDFGAARPISVRPSRWSALTREYAPAELFQSGEGGAGGNLFQGPQSDIFSFSIVLYELAAQVRPMRADQRLEKFRATGQDPYVPVREMLERRGLQAHYSSHLLDAIDRGTALFPKDRFSSAQEFASTLLVPNNFNPLGPQPNPPNPKRAEPMEPSKPPPVSHPGAQLRMMIMVGIILVVTGGLVGLLYFSGA